MKKLRLLFLAAKIELHWNFIKKNRKKGVYLLSRGVPLTSRKFYMLNKELSLHSTKTIKAQSEYERLSKAS